MSKRELQMLGVYEALKASSGNVSSSNEANVTRNGASPNVPGALTVQAINDSNSVPDPERGQKNPSPLSLVPDKSMKRSENVGTVPFLIREKDVAEREFREKYPKSSHRYFETSNKDPYAGVVVWAKMQGHPHWPARAATKQERESYNDKRPEPSPNQSLTQGEPQDILLLFFLGDHNLGTVKRANTEPFLARYRDFSTRLTTRPFLLALEEADAEAIRNVFKESPGNCMVCGGVDEDIPILLCDRCNSEAHTTCVGLTDVPEDDWLCPVCLKEAPLTSEDFKNGIYANRLRDRYSDDEDDDGEDEARNTRQWSVDEDKTLVATLVETKGDFDIVLAKLPGRTLGAARARHKLLSDRKLAPPIDRVRNRVSGAPPLSIEDVERYVRLLDGVDQSDTGLRRDKAERNMAASNNDDKVGTLKSVEGVKKSSPDEHAKKKLKREKTEPKEGENDVKMKTKGKPGRKPGPKPGGSSYGDGAASSIVTGGRSGSQTSTIDLFGNKLPSARAERVGGGVASQLRRGPGGARGTSKKLKKSYKCFVCGEDDADVTCSDMSCPRYYHKFCLGSRAPKEKMSSGDVWYCPWHYCAVCRQNGLNVKPDFLDLDESTKLPMIPDLLSSTRCRSKEIPPSALLAASGVLKIVGVDDSEEKEATTLHRCCGCPLALCTNHLFTAIEVAVTVFDCEERFVIGMERKAWPFFACERCAGAPKLIRIPPPPTPSEATSGSVPKNLLSSVTTAGNPSNTATIVQTYQFFPRTQFAKQLDIVLGELALDNEYLFKFAMRRPSKETVSFLSGPLGADAFFQMGKENNRPLSLDEVQRKIRMYAYTTVQDFEADMKFLSEALTLIYQTSQPKLAEAAQSLPFILSDILKFRAKDLWPAQHRGFVDDEVFLLNIQTFPEIVTKEEERLKGLSPWESYERFADPSGSDIEACLDHLQEYEEMVTGEKAAKANHTKRALGVLLDVAYGARSFDLSNPEVALSNMTSAKEVELAFEAHMDHIRGAMVTGAQLRLELQKLLKMIDNVDGTVLDADETILTLGTGNVEAERAAAFKSLQAKLGSTESALEIERRARKETENRLKALEQQMEHLKSSTSLVSSFKPVNLSTSNVATSIKSTQPRTSDNNVGARTTISNGPATSSPQSQQDIPPLQIMVNGEIQMT